MTKLFTSHSCLKISKPKNVEAYSHIHFFAAVFCKKEPVKLFFVSTLSSDPTPLTTVSVTFQESPSPDLGGSNLNGKGRKRRRIDDGILE